LQEGQVWSCKESDIGDPRSNITSAAQMSSAKQLTQLAAMPNLAVRRTVLLSPSHAAFADSDKRLIAWSGGFSGIGQFRQHADDPLEGDDRIASRIQPSQRSWR
jgi:hypothetical protein